MSTREQARLRAEKHRQRLLDTYGTTCEACGVDFPAYVLEFHHIIPEEKLFSVRGNITRSWASIVAEVAKCDLLCANCHREAHNLMGLEERDENKQKSI